MIEARALELIGPYRPFIWSCRSTLRSLSSNMNASRIDNFTSSSFSCEIIVRRLFEAPKPPCFIFTVSDLLLGISI